MESKVARTFLTARPAADCLSIREVLSQMRSPAPFTRSVWAPDVEPDVCLEQRGRVGRCWVSGVDLCQHLDSKTSTPEPQEEIPLMSLPIRKTPLSGGHGLDGAALLAPM